MTIVVYLNFFKLKNSWFTILFPVCSKVIQLYISFFFQIIFHYQISSVAQSCPSLCDPMNRSTPGLPVHHQLPEFTQTQVHRVSDAKNIEYSSLCYTVQFSHSVMSNSLWPPWTAACQPYLSITNSRSLPKFMCIKLVMPSSHLLLCWIQYILVAYLYLIIVFNNPVLLIFPSSLSLSPVVTISLFSMYVSLFLFCV